MNKSILIITIIFTISVAHAKKSGNQSGQNIGFDDSFIVNPHVAAINQALNKIATINALDTVVFDLSQAVINGAYIEFPVSILSDDTVNALDFSMKYNHSNFLYDTILNLTNYLLPYSYYNTFDSTIRFTSNSFQRYTNDTALVSVKFMMLSGPIHNSDLNSIVAYLNGDVCSVKIINPSPNNLQEYESEESFNIFPNPSYETLNIEVGKNSSVKLLDLNSREVLLPTNVNANQRQIISTENIPDGVYFLLIQNDNFSALKKILKLSH